MRRLGLALALALVTACDAPTPADIAAGVAEELFLAPVEEPTATARPTPQIIAGVLADRNLVRMDAAGRLVAVLDGELYHVRFVKEKQTGWRATLEPVARAPPTPPAHQR